MRRREKEQGRMGECIDVRDGRRIEGSHRGRMRGSSQLLSHAIGIEVKVKPVGAGSKLNISNFIYAARQDSDAPKAH